MESSVNFTREPIIETVITPREGCHLAVRSSKGEGHENYFVDAIEVVSFGHALFFRSEERANAFLVPVTDYEVVELKQTRMVLKSANLDRSIKIGGGKEAVPSERVESESTDSSSEGERSSMESRRQGQRRRRNRRSGRPETHHSEANKPAPSSEEGSDESLSESLPEETMQKPHTFISKLFPPPSTLIKETLSRYKPPEEEAPSEMQEELPSLDDSTFPHTSSEEETSSEE